MYLSLWWCYAGGCRKALGCLVVKLKMEMNSAAKTSPHLYVEPILHFTFTIQQQWNNGKDYSF